MCEQKSKPTLNPERDMSEEKRLLSKWEPYEVDVSEETKAMVSMDEHEQRNMLNWLKVYALFDKIVAKGLEDAAVSQEGHDDPDIVAIRQLIRFLKVPKVANDGIFWTELTMLRQWAARESPKTG